MKWKRSGLTDVGKWKDKITGMGKDKLLILFLAGILLLIIAIPGGTGEENEGKTSAAEKEETVPETEYARQMEQRLADILSGMEGAGQVSVMITLEASAEKIVEKDTERNSETVTESDSQGGSRMTENTDSREETVYEGEDNGDTGPVISKELSPEVEGVVVIAEGGDNAVVVKNITESVQALFGIDTHKIRVVKGRRAR